MRVGALCVHYNVNVLCWDLSHFLTNPSPEQVLNRWNHLMMGVCSRRTTDSSVSMFIITWVIRLYFCCSFSLEGGLKLRNLSTQKSCWLQICWLCRGMGGLAQTVGSPGVSWSAGLVNENYFISSEQMISPQKEIVLPLLCLSAWLQLILNFNFQMQVFKKIIIQV